VVVSDGTLQRCHHTRARVSGDIIVGRSPTPVTSLTCTFLASVVDGRGVGQILEYPRNWRVPSFRAPQGGGRGEFRGGVSGLSRGGAPPVTFDVRRARRSPDDGDDVKLPPLTGAAAYRPCRPRRRLVAASTASTTHRRPSTRTAPTASTVTSPCRRCASGSQTSSAVRSEKTNRQTR
jgi:hypothetical protein